MTIPPIYRGAGRYHVSQLIRGLPGKSSVGTEELAAIQAQIDDLGLLLTSQFLTGSDGARLLGSDGNYLTGDAG